MVTIFQEMLRVAPRIVVAESLPIARTPAQRAHLAMYELREEAFREATGVADDLHYLALPELTSRVEVAGGRVEEVRTLELDLPHWLAHFPRTMLDEIREERRREGLQRRWDEAEAMRFRSGEDHPPVDVLVASRSPTT